MNISMGKLIGLIKGIAGQVAGGGGGAFRVTFTSTDGETFTADKTLDEVLAAYEQDMLIEGVMDTGNGGIVLQPAKVVLGGMRQIDFIAFQIVGSLAVTLWDVNYHCENGITMKMRRIEAPSD